MRLTNIRQGQHRVALETVSAARCAGRRPAGSALVAATLFLSLRAVSVVTAAVAMALALAVVTALSLAAVPITPVVAARLALLRGALVVVSRFRPLLARRVAVELPHG